MLHQNHIFQKNDWLVWKTRRFLSKETHKSKKCKSIIDIVQLNAIHSCNESLQKTANNSGTRSLPIIRAWFVRFHNINFDARMQHVQKPLHVFIKGLQMYNEYTYIFFQIATLCLTKFIANSQRMPDTYTVLCLLIKKWPRNKSFRLFSSFFYIFYLKFMIPCHVTSWANVHVCSIFPWIKTVWMKCLGRKVEKCMAIAKIIQNSY